MLYCTHQSEKFVIWTAINPLTVTRMRSLARKFEQGLSANQSREFMQN
jgi:hypothetical protein